MRRRLEDGLRWLACALALTSAACGSGTPAHDGAASDVASPGMCGADVQPGQACNALEDLGTAVTPTCSTDTAPAGTGGAIADGTYVLTAQTMYDPSCTSPRPLSETITIAGDCIELAFGGLLPGTGSARVTTQGSSIAFAVTCEHFEVDGAVTLMPYPMQSYTATSTTFTLFSVKDTGATDVAVFTKR